MAYRRCLQRPVGQYDPSVSESSGCCLGFCVFSLYIQRGREKKTPKVAARSSTRKRLWSLSSCSVELCWEWIRGKWPEAGVWCPGLRWHGKQSPKAGKSHPWLRYRPPKVVQKWCLSTTFATTPTAKSGPKVVLKHDFWHNMKCQKWCLSTTFGMI